jgi:hypothetical protein
MTQTFSSDICKEVGGKIEPYTIVIMLFKGIEEWNVQDEIRASTTGYSFQFEHLKPYSDYILFVYAKTMEGLYNPDMPLKIQAKTFASIKVMALK